MKRVLLLLPLVLVACVPKRTAPPAAPPPQPAPPAPVVAPPPVAWEDRPRTEGDWRYGRAGAATTAAYIASNAGTGPTEEFLVVCEPVTRTIRLAVTRAGATSLTIRTTTLSRVLPVGEFTLQGDAYRAATLPAQDGLLDAMIYSRGKFLLGVEGQADLIIPPWPELARTVEDCRG